MSKENEEPRIEPYYQSQGKFLTDTLFDLGCLSESLSRDGIKKVEDLAALMFQQIADAANRCAEFTKKYKKSGHDEGERVRHEEEMRWIQRAQEAQKETFRQADEIQGMKEAEGKFTPWHNDMVAFLRKIVVPWPNADSIRAQHEVAVASQLLHKAFELGITGLDCRPGKIILGDEFVESGDAATQTEPPYMSVGQWACLCDDEPGSIINLCPKCGGRKVRVQCEAKHGINRCDREAGHEGPHRYRNGRHREEWG